MVSTVLYYLSVLTVPYKHKTVLLWVAAAIFVRESVLAVVQNLRVLNQNGISQACYIVKIYHSGLEPSK